MDTRESIRVQDKTSDAFQKQLRGRNEKMKTKRGKRTKITTMINVPDVNMEEKVN